MARETATDSPLEAAAGAAGPRVAEAFSILSNELRLSILIALWDASDPFGESDVVSFSELRERVGTVDSGQFNYHLDRLTGRFVEDAGDGYRLRGAGRRIVRSVVAGVGIEEPSLDPTPIDRDCSRCGAPVAVTYEDEWLYVVCTECDGRWGGRDDVPDGVLAGGEFPPAGVTDRDPEEMWQANAIGIYQAQKSAVEGVCDTCSGPMEASLDVCANHDDEGACDGCGRDFAVAAQFSCSVCGNYHGAPPRALVKHHPAVVAFYHERGLPVQYEVDAPEVARRATTQFKRHEQELVATDPPRVRVTVPYEGDTLTLTLDESCNVLEVTGPA